ncbi:ABC transporter permease subunit [Candidatus Dojkabacteria bacterium]|uniref:ABC transporter permease subunit n=1 Tax=Candidatus Dojkabacteria bacterium TaxID=2099670 RepID=A0A955L1T5_9BACT|nr:ABC transporter permease subunit [Candidatus Dojkabacteria bacterium]
MKYLHIFNFEVKRSYKIFIWWTIAWVLMILMLLPFYNTFSTQGQEFAQVYQSLPDAFKVAFNLNELSLSTISGYINTELMELLELFSCFFGLYLGSRSIQKEINNKSILFLLSKPVSRTKIFLAKVDSIFLLSVASNAILMLFLGFGVIFFTDADAPVKYLAYSFVVLMLMFTLYYALGILLGVIKDGGTIAIGAIVIIVTFMFNIMSKISDSADFLKYLTPYHYLDLGPVVSGQSIAIENIFFILIIALGLFVLGFRVFTNRDIDT